jgi:endonuclease/exonuclease/phosphatase family metal-dependent hydrolase
VDEDPRVSTHRLRLVTFNIAHARGLAPIQGLTSLRRLRLNLRKIAGLLDKLGADVVALQEIDECSVWSGSFDHLDYLRAHTGYSHAAFGINNRRSGIVNLSYGNAILSRYPMTSVETVVFGRRRVGEKGFLFAEIDVGGRIVPIVNLHLHFGSRSRRLLQLDLLVTWLRAKERVRGASWAVPPIVCGDLNNPDTQDDATAALLTHLGDYGEYTLHPLMGLTFPSPLPRRALDFVFVPPGCRTVRSEVVRSFLSDHRPVMVDFSVA